jgi:predicted transcriptional regulator YheO
MISTKTNLSVRDRLILDSYKMTIDGMAAYLGSAFEIVLHDLVDLEHSIIKIVNGHHSGRSEGAPITDFALSMLERIREENTGRDKEAGDFTPYTTYISASKFGHPVRSTTIVIFGENHKAIGLLCFNLYMDSPLSALSSIFGTTLEPPTQRVDENFISDSAELIAVELAKAKEQVWADNTVPAALKNKEIVGLLYQRGVFKLKNAVQAVAENLTISKNTVYLHLRSLENTGK